MIPSFLLLLHSFLRSCLTLAFIFDRAFHLGASLPCTAPFIAAPSLSTATSSAGTPRPQQHSSVSTTSNYLSNIHLLQLHSFISTAFNYLAIPHLLQHHRASSIVLICFSSTHLPPRNHPPPRTITIRLHPPFASTQHLPSHITRIHTTPASATSASADVPMFVEMLHIDIL